MTQDTSTPSLRYDPYDADIDADIFAAFTDKITVVDIKRALVRRFKPEQVARFGNIHLIYSSLRRCDFEVLIRPEIGRVIDSTQRTTGVTVSVREKRLPFFKVVKELREHVNRPRPSLSDASSGAGEASVKRARLP